MITRHQPVRIRSERSAQRRGYFRAAVSAFLGLGVLISKDGFAAAAMPPSTCAQHDASVISERRIVESQSLVNTMPSSGALTDDELMDLVQHATFLYFWDYGHPVSGMAREALGFGHSPNTVTTGGTGMGLMNIMVGAKRGFVTRSQAAARVLQILTFLDDVATRYHGAWSHFLDGTTGATIPFSPQDDGGDLVETAFLVQGILTVRQFFDDPSDPVEIEIRSRAKSMWECVEWDWYLQDPGSKVLYWHWSPNFGWAMNLPIVGYNEAMIAYVLAIASPTHSIPPDRYDDGWASAPDYFNPATHYGVFKWVGEDVGGPLFFTHYSFLGLDPRYKRDNYANYFDNSRSLSLIQQAYCIDNPGSFADYGSLVWGLTSSFDPFGYDVHSPNQDNGTITPSAAISAMPFTPEESLAAMRHMHATYGSNLVGQYGFLDAFNPTENWFAPGYLAIDQGTIVPMIENHRTGLCWKMFMANPEIKPALHSMGWQFMGDHDGDGDHDLDDYARTATCMSGPGSIGQLPPGCTVGDFVGSDFDDDNDVDLEDLATFMELFDGP